MYSLKKKKKFHVIQKDINTEKEKNLSHPQPQPQVLFVEVANINTLS